MNSAVSTVNQTLPISDKFTAYSAEVHKVVVMVNVGIIGLLPLMNQQNSSVFETHKPAFLSFCVFVLLYAVLRVGEAIVRLEPGIVPRLVAHSSHLLAALAALVLISVVSAAVALVLLLLWFLWLFLVAYDTYNNKNKTCSGAGLSQRPPV